MASPGPPELSFSFPMPYAPVAGPWGHVLLLFVPCAEEPGRQDRQDLAAHSPGYRTVIGGNLAAALWTRFETLGSGLWATRCARNPTAQRPNDPNDRATQRHQTHQAPFAVVVWPWLLLFQVRLFLLQRERQSCQRPSKKRRGLAS